MAIPNTSYGIILPQNLAKDLEEQGTMTENQPDQSTIPIIDCVSVGIFEENCYVYACPKTREAIIIDPGDEPERILEMIEQHQVIPKYILNTHGHIDHICAIDAVNAAYPVLLAIHPADLPMYTDERNAQLYGRSAPLVHKKPDLLLNEGDQITVGMLTLEVLHTPGHSPGSICLISQAHCIFSGDTLFYRSIGRTDLPGGNYTQIEQSIRKKLYTLDDTLIVFPGHGQPTTIAEEKYENPFVTVEE